MYIVFPNLQESTVFNVFPNVQEIMHSFVEITFSMHFLMCCHLFNEYLDMLVGWSLTSHAQNKRLKRCQGQIE